VTRASFILSGALAAGAVYGAGAVAPFVSQACRRRRRVRGNPQLAHTLEYLEAAFDVTLTKTEVLAKAGPLIRS
jgi:hypothetical protein